MEYDVNIKNRLRRVEGQVRGVLRMMEEGQDCRDTVGQMSAARSAMDRAIGVIVSENLEQCMREQMERGEDTNESVQEAINLLVKSR
jgi:DNA-binding FrmR family transcriptional regulator